MPDRINYSNNPFFFSCDELFAGRGGTPWTATGERNYVRRYRVIVKDKNLSEVDVIRCPGLPIPGSFFVTSNSFDLLAFVASIDAKQEHEDDWQNWIVEYKYSTRPPPGGFPTNDPNKPELEPPDMEWDSDVVHYSPRWDLDGNLFRNRANQPFKPAPQFQRGHTVLAITRNELGFNAALAARYNFAVNSDTFLGALPGTVQCQPPKAKMMFRGNIRYWRVSYRLKFGYLIDKEEGIRIIKPDGTEITKDDTDFQMGDDGTPVGMRKWQPRLLNHGTLARWYPGGPAERAPCMDHMTVRDVDLDRFGMKALEFERPVFIKFRMYRAMSFASLIVQGLA